MDTKNIPPAKQWNPPRPGCPPIVEPDAVLKSLDRYSPSDRELLAEILTELRTIRAIMQAHSAI